MRRGENFFAPCIWTNSEFLEAPMGESGKIKTLIIRASLKAVASDIQAANNRSGQTLSCTYEISKTERT